MNYLEFELVPKNLFSIDWLIDFNGILARLRKVG